MATQIIVLHIAQWSLNFRSFGLAWLGLLNMHVELELSKVLLK